MPGYDHWRLAPADRFVREGRVVKLAHDPGDPQITSHCPFCGSGQIVGRSDGTIGCDFCGMNYIVRVQPAFPGMPQAPGMGGAPTDIGPDGMDPAMEGEVGPDGMPLDPAMEGEVAADGGFPPEEGEEEGFPPEEGEDAGAEEEGGFPPEGDDDGGDDAPPPKKDKAKSKSKDKSKSKKEGAFRTIAGDQLDEDAYVRHLAVLHSGGDPAVIAAIRAEAGR
jgi:hypothetical protein